jgi:hypothetical protein
VVERQLPKLDVAGSTPVSRSNSQSVADLLEKWGNSDVTCPPEFSDTEPSLVRFSPEPAMPKLPRES